MDDMKPSRIEDEYFVKKDAELIKQQRAHLDAQRANVERQSHYMKCPKCGHDLIETEHHKIKLDRCSKCHGVWFDAGEVEMLEHVDQSQIRSFVRSMFGLKW